MRTSAIPLFASFVAACSLGALDGFSGGTDAADGGVEAAPQDSGSNPAEASAADAGDASGGAKSFCETLTTPSRACLDFEDGAVPFGFSRIGNDTSAAIEDGGKTGKGFRSTVPAGGSNGSCLVASFAGPRTGLTLEADVRFAAVGTGNYDILNLDGTGGRELGISATGTTIYVEEDFDTTGGGHLKPTTAQARTTFQPFRFAMKVVGTVAETELFVDGVSVLKHSAAAEAMNGTVELNVGDCEPTNIASWEAVFDNVVVYETK